MNDRRTSTTIRRHGFSLVELIVVLGVIVFLLGLTMAVGTAAVERSHVRETENTLRLLDVAMHEWEAVAGRQLSWWDKDYDEGDDAAWRRADVRGDTPEVLIITEMLQRLTTVPSVAQIIGQIEPTLVVRYEAGEHPAWIRTPVERQRMDGFDGQLTVLDAWGWPIYATHPGRPWRPGEPAHRDDDGTIQTYNEMGYGVARQRRICFLSAGPDRQFGRLAAPVGTELRERAADNVYSYRVQTP